MNRNLLITLAILVSVIHVEAQELLQTVRGNVIDQDSQVPIPGVTVVVVGSNPLVGASTDENGNYRLNNIPMGRVTLKVSSVGYEDKVIPNILVGSAKEVVLNITLTESVSTLNEIVVSAGETKGEILNEMSIVSARSFSVEETRRYAGSFDDPARLAASFAGVAGDAEGNNDIIVRGNSSRGVLWRLEGIAIPNPNHFAGEGTTGGPINALSSNMLANSDFYTGAFSPEYGDATSGVFDMKLKNGNNEKREYTATVSTLGLDVAAEGPFRKNYAGSYIANYRYSSLDLLSNAGIVDFGGIPKYQDLSFKIHLPANKKHHFSLFGLGGLSSIADDETDEENETIILSRAKMNNKLGVIGLSHLFQISDNIYIRSSLAATGSSLVFEEEIPDGDNGNYIKSSGANFGKTFLIGTTAFNYKINAKQKVEAGIIFTRQNFKITSDDWDFSDNLLVNELDEKGHADVTQAYVTWKYRASENLTFVNGIHYIRLGLDGQYSLEPRSAIRWQANHKGAFSAGFGIHSKLEGIGTYLAKVYDEEGSFTQPNKDLALTKSAHFVLGYDHNINSNTHLKVETYYQHLYNVPVDHDPTSPFSMLNETDGYTARTLINEGSGKNYGVEFTLERYFHRGFYYMSTLSLFRSLYTANDGVERRSAFDNNYVGNLIGGKEFPLGNENKHRVLFLNTKIVLIGGKRYTPVDLAASTQRGEEVRDETRPFGMKSEDIFRLDFSVGLRRNRPKTTHEFKIDVQNILNNEVVVGQYYVIRQQKIISATQLGILPTISYRISF